MVLNLDPLFSETPIWFSLTAKAEKVCSGVVVHGSRIVVAGFLVGMQMDFRRSLWPS